MMYKLANSQLDYNFFSLRKGKQKIWLDIHFIFKDQTK